MKARLNDGSSVVEIIDNPDDDYILLTVSKFNYDEDHVQIKLSRRVASALGHLLIQDVD